MSTVVCVAVVWIAVGLLLGIPIGKGLKRADAIASRERAAAFARHPVARGLSDAEVQRRIREMEQGWVA